MHGREDGQDRKRIRHMWSVASRGSTATVGVDSSSSSVNSFSKDGRKITVGDCALFKPPNDSPPFIGFIRSLLLDKDNNLKLLVNWLYRPAEVVLGKGVALEAAPNEVFYSFHRDETLAASLLHPCKVAFLPKGVKLPSGVSAFVCRRVYDITNKCLWWLTDKDFIKERQEEVDQLLLKCRLEMHATVQQHQGTNSPKSANGAAPTSPLKHSLDSLQNNSTYASHPKGKKRELGDRTPEPLKRERLMKDGGDSPLSRAESSLKSELTKMTDKGGLVDYESVEKIVQLLRAEKLQKKVDFSCRSMLAGIIACTDRFDCLSQFVQLRGLTFLDEWLREILKGKVGDSGCPIESDKCVEDFLFVLLRALDKLPVNLNALQMCNIGKSVNKLRSHKNLEIQKKARSLVDTWKKRVELEMNMNDIKPNSNHHAPWPGRSRHDASHVANKQPTVPSDIAQRSSGQLGSLKSCPLKSVHGDNATSAASVPVVSPKAATSMTTNYKDGQTRKPITGGVPEPPHIAVKEEKSSSSSQSHTNSQCSSDHARNIVRSGKEDAKCSTAGSKSMNKTKGSSRQRRSAKDSGPSQNSSLPSISPSEKFSESTITSECNGADALAENDSLKIIVEIPNRGHGPEQVANNATLEEPSCRNTRASSPVHSDKLDQDDAVLREKNYGLQTNEVDMIPAALSDAKEHTSVKFVSHVPDVSKEGCQVNEGNVIAKRSVESSMNSINALIDSCVKYSEAHASMSVGDDSGMNLLASVATGEITRSGASSPAASPPRNKAIANTSITNNEGATLCNDGEPSAPCVTNVYRQQNGNPLLKSNGTMDAFSGGTVSPFSACNVEKSNEVRGEKMHLKEEVIKDESHDSVSCKKQIANTFSPAQDGIKHEIQCKEVLHKDQKISAMQLSSKCDEKNNSEQAQNSNALLDHGCSSLATHSGSSNKDEEQVGDSTLVHEEPVPKHSPKLVTEKTDDLGTCNTVIHGGSKRIKMEKTSLSCPDVVASALVTAGYEEKVESKHDMVESKDTEMESHSSSKKLTESDVQVESKDEPASCTDNMSSAAVMSDKDRLLGFDLNEGFSMDDMKNGEPTTMVETVSSAPISVSAISSAPNGLPTSVTVASAAKRPFVPPEDLLRNKSEVGWKGSAATSAFRPAEPRKLAENRTVSNKTPLKESMASKPVRAFLDFDLNVKDEISLEGMVCQDSLKESNYNPGSKSGGFELDLNKVDDSQELGQRSVGIFQRFEVSVPPLQSSQSTNSIINDHINTKRNFDLNDGPTADELTMESYNHHVRGNIPSQSTFGMRMNNAAAGSISSWYSPGTTYSATRPPLALSDMSILVAPGPHQRILGGPSTASQFNTEFYRGSVLSSSPALNFTSTPFQYPAVFPFGSTFPLPTSLPGNSAAYMDPSSGARFCSPAVANQMMGTTAAVSSQYLRPCVVSLPDVSSNGESSQKWGRQGLDLNCGPLGVDAEGKDEAVLFASRQHPAVNSPSMMDEQTRAYQVTSGVLKRKEPEGGWGADRMSYKHPSWQ